MGTKLCEGRDGYQKRYSTEQKEMKTAFLLEFELRSLF